MRRPPLVGHLYQPLESPLPAPQLRRAPEVKAAVVEGRMALRMRRSSSASSRSEHVAGAYAVFIG
jgi:hypothetical protein